ncbi:hypothetical protein [Photobacterium alginatilyticum]|uniref:Polysaccharide biosynthesis protein n=1 Tax=Photobacterium alginatilyticum TaxID=1775171 RepID=A0ABW9YCU9_9GAMM|nr:hypothetical protein [Photobacterium alginatilyticum]NBI51594.1 hypothetical protein [Photobacterium alginatilyticum]
MKNVLKSFSLNFTSVAVNIGIFNIILLPYLYDLNNESYLQFTSLLYGALFFVHSLNSTAFNYAVINCNKNKFDVSLFLVFFVVYAIASYVISDSFFMFLFLVSLYIYDTVINWLRIKELDYAVAAVNIVNMLVLSALVMLLQVDVLLSNIIISVILSILSLVFIFSKKTVKFIVDFQGLRHYKISALLYNSSPVLSRYVDKILVLGFFETKVQLIALPIISMLGIVMLPISIGSKVLMRSYKHSASSYNLKLVLLLLLVSLNVLILATSVGVSYLYNIEIDFLVFIAVFLMCLSKIFNILDLLNYSLFSRLLESNEFITKFTILILSLTFAIVCLLNLLVGDLNLYFLFLLPLAFFLIVTSQLIFLNRSDLSKT